MIWLWKQIRYSLTWEGFRRHIRYMQIHGGNRRWLRKSLYQVRTVLLLQFRRKDNFRLFAVASLLLEILFQVFDDWEAEQQIQIWDVFFFSLLCSYLSDRVNILFFLKNICSLERVKIWIPQKCANIYFRINYTWQR